MTPDTELNFQVLSKKIVHVIKFIKNDGGGTSGVSHHLLEADKIFFWVGV